MIHGVLSLVAPLAADGPVDNSQVTVALIGLAGLIMSALIAGYFGTRGERASKAVAPEVRRQLDEAVYDAAIAENDARDEAARADRAEARVEVLERALIVRGFAPWRFVTGEEDDTHARVR